MGVQELKESVYTTKELPTLPIVARQIMNASVEEDSFKALSNVIEKDPSLTMKLLGLANSALYGQQSQVGSVRRAVTVVGIEMLKRLALCAFVKAAWGNDVQREHFWKHSMAVAFGTDWLSKHYEAISADDAFCAGLLHDVGVLVLDTIFPEAYKKIEKRIVVINSRQEAEQEILGVDHTQAGAWFAERWQLPQNQIEGIAGHHSDSEDSMSEMIRVAEQAALNADLGMYGKRKEAALHTDLGMYGKRKQVPVEQQEEVEAYIRSKGYEIDVFFRMTSKPAA